MPMPSDYISSLIKAATTKCNAAYNTSVILKIGSLKIRAFLPKWINFHPSADK